MRSFQLRRAAASAGAAFAILLAASPTLASEPPAAVAPAPLVAQAPATAQISGTVRSGSAIVPGATVKISGPTIITVVSDATGAFTATVQPGIYRIDVSRGGYSSAELTDLAIVAGTTVPVSVSLNQADLSSLRTIGRVSTANRGTASQINTGTAVSSYLPGTAFTNQGSPQINDVLQHIPDVTILHMGSQQTTSIIVGGVQPYETQVLIDGHPVAVSQYGVFLSQYLPSYLLGGVETQSGPGNTTPFANIAVGGTVNLLTPSFTRNPTAEFVTGIDSWKAQFSHLTATGSAGRLHYAVAVGTDGTNGPFYQKRECDVTPEGNGTGIIQFCGDASGSFFSKGEVLKLGYDFSPKTSFEAGFVGGWGGYSPQGTAWATSNNRTTIVGCSAGGLCTNPANAGLIGSTFNTYGWYPGSYIYTNQTLFDAQLRTAIGNDTFLFRPYVGNIEPETVIGTGEVNYPKGYSPVGANPNAAPGSPANNAYQAFATACGNSFGAVSTNTLNGQIECADTAYSTFEQDKLYGSTFTYLHPFGENLLDFTYDFHSQSTFAYVFVPANVTVPFSTARYSTFSLTSDLHPVRNVGLDLGLYNTNYKVDGVKPVSVTDPTLTGFTRTITRFDPHAALTFRPNSDVSYRASFGTSATFPNLGQLSGLANYAPPAQSLGVYALGGTLTDKNANLSPEVSIAYGLGMDKRLGRNSVLSLDLQDSVIHDVFEGLTTSVPLNGGLEGIISQINVAKLKTELATIKYRYSPPTGFGFNTAFAAERSILQGVPASFYSVGSASFPVNDVQICGDGVDSPSIPACIAYLKGYTQFTYTGKDGTFMGLGVDYEGKNNSYYQPPFALVDFTFIHPYNKSVDVQVAVQNLLNTNNFGTYASTPGAGTPVVAGTVDAAGNAQQTSYTADRIPAPPRTVRLSLRFHAGR